MKREYRLLLTGFVASGLLALACVSGETVGPGTGTGGHVGGGMGGTTGAGMGGTTGGAVGGTTGAGTGGRGTGGVVGGGTGGRITGAGGTIVAGTGGATAGGTGGLTAGGVGCPRTNVLIDNFDDPTRGGPATGGYFDFNCGIGSWYTYSDATVGSTLTPTAGVAFVSDMPGHGGTGYAAHITGTGFTNYGFGLGINVNAVGTVISPYNASAYSGITFWAMGTVAGSLGANMIRVGVPTTSTSLPANGGACVAPATTTPPIPYCEGHYGKVIALTAAWAQYTIKWTDLTLDSASGSVGSATFLPATFIGIHWQAAGTATAAASMNVWVDDLAFVP